MKQVHWKQVWPPADAISFIALATANDSRDGWVRWTWLGDGSPVRVSGMVDVMLGGRSVPEVNDPVPTHAWALEQGWGYVSELVPGDR